MYRCNYININGSDSLYHVAIGNNDSGPVNVITYPLPQFHHFIPAVFLAIATFYTL